MLSEAPAKARPSRCPPTAIPPSLVARMTIRGIDRCPLASAPRGRRGYSPATGVVWTQQGEKLVSTGAMHARQGMSVALSADGNVAIVGGLAGDGGVGAASVFTRSGGIWTQGEKLVSAGAVGKSSPSVALSADGSVVLLGGSNDNGASARLGHSRNAPVTGFRSKSWLAPAKQEKPASSVPISS